MELVELEVICERIEVARNAAGLGAGRRIDEALAPAAAVEGDDAIALPRESRCLGFPAFAGAGIGVQQHDRGAGASGVSEPEFYAGKLDILARERRFGSAPARRKTQTSKRQADNHGRSWPPQANAEHLSLHKRWPIDRGLCSAPPRSYILNRATFWVCSPSPAMLSLTTSPTFKYFGSGFMPSATPGGVPVMMTSPGSRTMNWEQYHTRWATPKTIVLVEPFWRVSPFTVSHMSRFCGWGISSLVTSQGPSGPNVSEPLPLVHCPARSIWNSRSETSLARQ